MDYDQHGPPRWRTVEVRLSRLREPPGPNPNVMSDEDMQHLVANMRAKGCLQPVLARGALPPPPPADPLRPTGDELEAECAWLLSDDPLEVVDGSHRREAAAAAGLTAVPVTVITATDDQARALRVGMNKIRGDLDLAEVGRMLADLADQGASAADVELCGYDESQVADLVASVADVDREAEAMSALGSDAPAAERERTWSLEVHGFTSKADRDRAKRALRGRGGTPAAALLSLVGGGDE